MGLLAELGDPPLAVGAQHAELVRAGGGDGLHRDRDVRSEEAVPREKIDVIHPVEVVSREDEDVPRAVGGDVRQHLPHGVGRPLKPVDRARGLLGREDLDEAPAEDVEAVRPRDVLVEGRRVVLREHVDAVDPRVDAVRDRDVDEPVAPRERHGRLRAHPGEREEPCAPPAAEYESDHVAHGVSVRGAAAPCGAAAFLRITVFRA